VETAPPVVSGREEEETDGRIEETADCVALVFAFVV
jgi:hypothetical protein